MVAIKYAAHFIVAWASGTEKNPIISQKKGTIVGMFPHTSMAAHFGRVHFQEAVRSFLVCWDFVSAEL
jgi:hypothetical protein